MNHLTLGNGVTLRSADVADLPGLFRVCLETGDSGKDATHLHNLPDLLGEIYVAPYVLHQPDFSFALEDQGKIVGYLFAALDTKNFEEKLQREYWPALKAKYEEISDSITKKDQELLSVLQTQGLSSSDLTTKYPSHLHIDIISEYQGNGYGKTMISFLLDRLKAAGSKGVHLHMAASNDRAFHFYRSYGFSQFSETDSDKTLALQLH